MYSDDGQFYARLKEMMKAAEVPVEKPAVVAVLQEAAVEGDIAVEELLPQETNLQDTTKQQIMNALNERPQLANTTTTRVNLEQNVSETPPISLRTVQVTAPAVTVSAEKDLDIRFATKFIGNEGKFLFSENLKEAIASLRVLKMEHNWGHIFCWENEIKDAFADNNFQRGAIGFTIENSDAAISLCETLVADEGIILLNPKQASRRRLPCFPKTHIILADVSHLIGSEAEALERFYKKHKGELPSIIKLGNCNNGHFYDKQRLILNAEGPEDVYVILVDEVIPPSLRP